jgi:hypothetical protein
MSETAVVAVSRVWHEAFRSNLGLMNSDMIETFPRVVAPLVRSGKTTVVGLLEMVFIVGDVAWL